MSIQSKLMKVTKNKFIKNVVTVASGTAIAQIITMAFSPFITRIYGPEIYGVFGVYSSVISMLVPIAALTYPIAIVLPKQDEEAKDIGLISLIVTFVISLVFTIIFLLCGNSIVNLFKIEIIGPFLFFIPLMMFLDGTFQIFKQWLIRKRSFKIKAKADIINSLVLNGSHAIIGFLAPFAITLISIATFGKGLYTISLMKGIGIDLKSVKETLRSILDKFRNQKGHLKLIYKKYIDFPKYRAPQVLINGISESLPVLMLSALFSPATSAFYVIGVKVLGIPTQLVGNAVGDVFYPRITEGHIKGEDITKLLLKANIILATIGIIPFGLVILFGPFIFSIAFGGEWEIAGEYARWLALWSYFMLITRPTIKALPVIGAQKFHLVFTIITIVARLVALILGAFILKDDNTAIILFSITGAFLYLLLAIITLVKTKKSTAK